ncbi:MAG: glycosyl hydrolase family 28 protein [Bacteroidota bacterium]|nr:glycosyl hydrolase family 28 protein [Bacteroidota bacterium]
MKKKMPTSSKQLLFVFLVLCVSLSSFGQTISLPAWASKTGATPISNLKSIFKVNSYGAVSDGQTLCTKAIQKAIDACAQKGGGIVTFEPGTYVTGSIFLKSNVQLRIDKGVLILGSQNFDDYPEIDTRIAGIEMKWPAALINVINQKNAAVTGEGIVNARGKFCWDKYARMRNEYNPKGLRWIVDYDAKRVRTILVQSSSNINIKGLTLKNAGFWTVQLLYSKNITVDGLTIRNNEDGHGPSTDGIDIDSSSWILVQNCDIDCNDDDFCLKAGRDWDGLRVNRPTEYVLIRKCIARKGGGMLTMGSETSGCIRHVVGTDLIGKGTGNGLNIKSAFTRGGTVEDIHFQNIQMDSVGYAVKISMNWNPSYSYSTLPKGYNPDSIPAHWKTMLHKVEPASAGTPHFKDVYVSNVKATYARVAIDAEGMAESLLQNFNFNDVTINAGKAGTARFAESWKFNKFKVNAQDGSTFTIVPVSK